MLPTESCRGVKHVKHQTEGIGRISFGDGRA